MPSSIEPEVKAEPTMPKPDEIKPKNAPSATQQVKDKINEKLNSGFQLTDKNSKLELNKIVRDELKLAKGWSSDINKAIREIAVDRKIQISDLGFKNDKIGDTVVNLIKNEIQPTEKQLQSNVQTPQSPHGALPKNTSQSPHGALPKTVGSSETTQTQQSEQQQQEPEKKYMSQTAQKKLISNGLTKLVLPLYTALGICELDEEEIKEESKIPKSQQVKKDFEDLAGEIDEYLTENEIRLPALLNHISIVISIFVVLVLPVIKFKFMSSKQDAEPQYDETADEVKVET